MKNDWIKITDQTPPENYLVEGAWFQEDRIPSGWLRGDCYWHPGDPGDEISREEYAKLLKEHLHSFNTYRGAARRG